MKWVLIFFWTVGGTASGEGISFYPRTFESYQECEAVRATVAVWIKNTEFPAHSSVRERWAVRLHNMSGCMPEPRTD